MKWYHTPIKWLEYNKTTTNKLVISIASGVEDRNFHSLLVGMENGTVTLEVRVAVSYKAKHRLSI